jgi:hypothetical protein
MCGQHSILSLSFHQKSLFSGARLFGRMRSRGGTKVPLELLFESCSDPERHVGGEDGVSGLNSNDLALEILRMDTNAIENTLNFVKLSSFQQPEP